MSKRLPQLAMWLLCVAIAVGCSSSPAPSAAEPRDVRLGTVAKLYHEWSAGHLGSAPANRQQFVSFIQQDPTKWNKAASTVDELLTSPRDNQPFVVAYGKMPKDSAETGFPWIAREKTGVDGKVNVVDLRGRVQLLDAQEMSKILPST